MSKTVIQSCKKLQSGTAIRMPGGDEVNTITEAMLAQNFEHGAVKEITIQQVTGGFEVHARVAWRTDGELRVIKARSKEPKVWASLDRLVKHYRDYPNLPPIILKVKKKRRRGAK